MATINKNPAIIAPPGWVLDKYNNLIPISEAAKRWAEMEQDALENYYIPIFEREAGKT